VYCGLSRRLDKYLVYTRVLSFPLLSSSPSSPTFLSFLPMLPSIAFVLALFASFTAASPAPAGPGTQANTKRSPEPIHVPLVRRTSSTGGGSGVALDSAMRMAELMRSKYGIPSTSNTGGSLKRQAKSASVELTDVVCHAFHMKVYELF
jgi:hypothetical protein